MIGDWLLTFARANALWLGIAGAAGLYHWHSVTNAYRDGAANARAAITEANRKAGEKADAASRDVMNCPPDLWNRARGKCANKP